MKTKIKTRYGNYIVTFSKCSTIEEVRIWLNGGTDRSTVMGDFLNIGDKRIISTKDIIEVVPYISFKDRVDLWMFLLDKK